MDRFTCSNRYNHVSGTPGYGRTKCPNCNDCYVKSPDRLVKEALEKIEYERRFKH